MAEHKTVGILVWALVCGSVSGLGRGSAARAAGDQEFSVHLNVLSQADEKVKEFEVQCHSHAHGYTLWKKGHNGELTLTSRNRDFPQGDGPVKYQLIVRATGYAPEIVVLDNPTGHSEKQVVLHEKKRELILRTCDGRAIPAELEPIVVFAEFESEALRSFQHGAKRDQMPDMNITSLVKVEVGRYAFHVSDDAPEFFVFVDHPGFMRAFRTGPFRVSELKNNRLEIELPKPGSIEVRFDPGESSAGDLPFKACRMEVLWSKPGTDTGYLVVMAESNEARATVKREYFAPGDYWVDLSTHPKDAEAKAMPGKVNPGAYRDMRKFKLEEGQDETVVFEYTPYDPDGYKGEHSAKVAVRWSDGSAAAGEPYHLYWADRHYLEEVLVRKGTLSGDGRADLSGLKGGNDAGFFTLIVKEQEVGRFPFQLEGEQKKRTLEFVLGPIEGRKIPDATVQDIFNGREVKLSEFKGRVAFVEFWASWCGPCQTPMAHLCAVQASKGGDWEDKAVLVAISIDSEREALADYVRNRGWTGVRHFWCHKGGDGFKSDVAKAYGIWGVPTGLLVDREGKIIWRGHPGGFEIEERIDALLTDAD